MTGEKGKDGERNGRGEKVETSSKHRITSCDQLVTLLLEICSWYLAQIVASMHMHTGGDQH